MNPNKIIPISINWGRMNGQISCVLRLKDGRAKLKGAMWLRRGFRTANHIGMKKPGSKSA